MAAAAGRRQRARRAWLAAHRWLGLLLGLPIVLLCLSGLALSYWDDIDAALNPGLFPPPAAPSATPGEMLQAAAPACEGAEERWLWLPHGMGPGRVLCAPPGRSLTEVVVDGRRVVVARDYAWTPLGIAVGLHTRFLLGEPGRIAAGGLALVLVVSVASGLWLWWPAPGGWGRALRVAPWGGAGATQRLHRAAGALAALVLLVVGATALRLEFPESAAALLRPASGAKDPYAIGRGLRGSGGVEPLPPDRLVALAAAAFPGAVLTDVWLPADPARPAMVGFRQQGERNRDAGHSLVWVDQGEGHILARHDPFAADPGMAALTWLETLHSGEAFGRPGRLLVQAGALAAVLLFATGLLTWTRRRRKRKGAAGSPAAPPETSPMAGIRRSWP